MKKEKVKVLIWRGTYPQEAWNIKYYVACIGTKYEIKDVLDEIKASLEDGSAGEVINLQIEEWTKEKLAKVPEL